MGSFLLWYLVITLAGVLALPVVYRFLGKLPDHGFSFARPVGLLVWGFLFWILTSFRILQNDVGGVFFALLLLAGIGTWMARQAGWQELKHWLSDKRGTVLISEILFFVAFAGWTVVRAANPEIIGTEKPMELAFINGILRSPYFPPNDVWLSGYSISYYHFGYVLVAMLIRATSVISTVGFNLAIALWFGLSAQAAYGVIYSLLGVVDPKKVGKSILAPVWALLGPVFILIVSNFEGFLEMLHARGMFWSQAADGQLVSKFWSWLNILEINQPPALNFTWVPQRINGIWWWRASRVLHDFKLNNGGDWEVIDEFPFFSYLLADLHPHILSMPFVLLAIALALNLYLAGGKWVSEKLTVWTWFKNWFNRKKLRVGELGIVLWLKSPDFWFATLVIGGLAFLNFWDFPIYLALYCAINVLVQHERAGWSWRRVVEFIEQGVVMGIMGILFYLPFHLGFASQAGGILPSLSFYTRGVIFWVMFGSLLTPIVIWLLWSWRSKIVNIKIIPGIKFSVGVIGGLWLFSYLLGFVAVSLYDWAKMAANIPESGFSSLALAIANLGDLFYWLHGAKNGSELILGSLALRLINPGTWLTMLVLLVFVWGILASFGKTKNKEVGDIVPKPEPETSNDDGKDHSSRFVLVLLLIGAGLAIVPEFIYLRDQFGTRMNTIFKFYFQVWILWGLAAAYTTVILWHRMGSYWKYIYRVVGVCVFLMALAYPIYGILEKTNGFNPTIRADDGHLVPDWSLDGSRHMQRYDADEWAGIVWLQSAPLGVVVEAVGGSYSQYARVSTYSGQPTLLGWPGHEGQWRGGGEEMGTRETDIQRLYETKNWDDVKVILEQYHIRYIFIGSLERNTYKVNEKKFTAYLPVVFEKNTVVIYGVPDY